MCGRTDVLIHRYWTGPTSPPCEPFLGSCLKSLNPDAEITDWNDDTLPPTYHKYFNDAQVCPSDVYKHRANIVRLLLLHDFGGAWYDYDIIPLLPVSALPVPSVASHETLCNSFMAFNQGDHRLSEAIDALAVQPAIGLRSMLVSGSLFLRRFLSDVHHLEYPFAPNGRLLSCDRPFAVQLGIAVPTHNE